MRSSLYLVTQENNHKYMQIPTSNNYMNEVIKVDITGLHKHTKEFEEFIENFEYPHGFSGMQITDAVCEKYIQPFNKWIAKRKILYPDENLSLWMQQYKDKSIGIDIRNIDSPITIPKSLHGITLSFIYGEKKVTQEITIQDLDSIILTEGSIATLMHASERKLLKMKEDSYIKLERTLIKTLDTMIENIEKAIEQKDDKIYKHEIYRWHRLNLWALPALVETHIDLYKDTSENIDNSITNSTTNSITEKLKTAVESANGQSYYNNSTNNKLHKHLKIIKQTLGEVIDTGEEKAWKHK